MKNPGTALVNRTASNTALDFILRLATQRDGVIWKLLVKGAARVACEENNQSIELVLSDRKDGMDMEFL
jgi:hypothetical protein